MAGGISATVDGCPVAQPRASLRFEARLLGSLFALEPLDLALDRREQALTLGELALDR